jgi:DNA processing protein
MTLTPGLASRLSARLLKRFESPEGIFRATLTQLESCNLPAGVAQSIVKKESFKRAEKELAAIRNIPNCMLINWSDEEYPQNLLQIYDPPVLLYVCGNPQILNHPCLSIVGTRRPTLYGTQMAERLGRDLAARTGDPKRDGPRHRCAGPSRGAGGQRLGDRRARHGHRRVLSQREQKTV